MKTIRRCYILLLPLLLFAAGCDNTAPESNVAERPLTDDPAPEPTTLDEEEATMPDDANIDTAPTEQNTYFTADAHEET